MQPIQLMKFLRGILDVLRLGAASLDDIESEEELSISIDSW